MNRFIIVFLSLLTFNAKSQPENTTPLLVKKTQDFTVDGKGSAKNWEETAFVELTKRKGDVNYTSRFKILYSEKGIYCLYVSDDKKITSTLREDFADIYNEDVVECFFWTDEKSPIYFEYELSPYNYELPILVPNYDGKFFGWRPWHYEGDKLTRRGATILKNETGIYGWVAEFFIPFALLNPLQNVPPRKGMKWRANFYRIDYDQGMSTWTWQPIRKNFHDYEKFGYIVFE